MHSHLSPVPGTRTVALAQSKECTINLLKRRRQKYLKSGAGKGCISRLANGGELCIWRLVPPVGHCNTLYVGSVKGHHRCSSQEDPPTLGSSKYKYYGLHLSYELFPKNLSDLEGVKNEPFHLLYPEFNVWKK